MIGSVVAPGVAPAGHESSPSTTPEAAEPAPAPPATAPARATMSRATLSVFIVVTALSVSVIFLGAFAFGLSAVQEQRSQHQLYQSFRSLLDPSSPVGPSIGGTIAEGTPVALLNSSVAGLRNVVVVEGTSSQDLLEGPGHLPDSPLPGQLGDSVLIGRSTIAGGPFARVASLVRGDVLSVTTGQGRFRFVVEDTRVAGDRIPVLPKSGAALTLVTSEGSGSLGHFLPSRLVYVDTRLVGKAVAAPPGRPTQVAAADLPGHTDPAAWPFLVFWLQGLVLAGFLAVWLWFRWGRWQTWLVGAPVIFGLLWGMSGEVMRLLPNVA